MVHMEDVPMSTDLEERVAVPLLGSLDPRLIDSSLAESYEPKTPCERGVGRLAKTYFRHQPHTDRKVMGDLHTYIPSIHRIAVAWSGCGREDAKHPHEHQLRGDY
jgi:hypothetical protein